MKKNKKAFSILMSILFIGFLLVLVVGMFNLMLRDMKDNRGGENYLKAYAGAEGAMELGLLKIKKEGYGVDKDLDASNSGILSFNNPAKNNDPKISYIMDIGVKTLTGQKIGPGKTVIIPLFSNNIQISEPEFSVSFGGNSIIWNIIGDKQGMSGSGSFDYSDNIYYKTASGTYDTESIEDFLQKYNKNYLMLFNNSTNTGTYNLKAEKNFSKSIGVVISNAKVGKYKQNIITNIDNTEFLNMLKYSIFAR